MRPIRLLATALVALLAAGCARHVNAPAEAMPMPETRFRVDTGVRFTPDGAEPALFADVYTPVTLGPYPTIVIVPAGRWETGRARDMRFVAEYLAQRGFAAVAVEHRPASRGDLDAQLGDLLDALRWIDREARSRRLDMQRVGLVGFESGGHLATLLTLSQSAAQPLPGLARDAALPPIRAVVAGGAPLDLAAMADNPDVSGLMGAADAEALRRASPLHRVHAQAPPFFLFHGTTDGYVPVAQAEAMVTRLERHGVPVQLYRMSLRGHTTTYLTVSGALQAGARFLWRHVAEPGQPEAYPRSP